MSEEEEEGRKEGEEEVKRLTGVWKVECRWVRKGWLQPSARSLFSTMVASTSSSSSTTSFLRALTAKYCSLPSI